jgi:hypothetical protein
LIDIQKIHERKKLRNVILEELYELRFSGGPEAFSSGRMEGLVGTKEDLFTDNERHKAFHYLLGKNLIVINSAGNDILAVQITSEGIDYIETETIKQNLQ